MTTKTTPYAFPGSRLVLRADAPRSAWLKMRMEGVGGSDVSKLVGLSKYGSAYDVWLDKMGLSPEIPPNIPMRMGVLLEPIIKELFTEETGLQVRSAGLHRSRENPFMQVTIDGATADGGVLECKSLGGFVSHEWDNDQVPDHAELQIMHGLAVTGRSHGWAAGLVDGRTFILREVARDEALIKDIISLEKEFWENHVLTKTEPPVTAVSRNGVMARYLNEEPDAVFDMDEAQWFLLKERLALAAVKSKEADADKYLAETELRAMVENAEYVKVNGETVATLRSTGTFASSRFVAEHPDVAKEYMTTKIVLDNKAVQAAEPDLYQNFRSRVLRVSATKKEK